MGATDKRPVSTRPAAQADGLTAMDPTLARIYSSRGISSADELDYSLSKMLPLSSFDGLAEAAALVLSHRDERIVVVGDFDADGATSTALLLRCLRAYGFADVSYLVPNRFEYGYGLTPEIVNVAALQKPALIITVDNGISSVDGVARANHHGIDVLVTDHHLPPDVLPDAAAILNPNLEDHPFSSKALAGVGVAFYLAAEIGRQLQAEGKDGAAKIPVQHLDLVALGTVADVVPLDHNNRILIDQGLQRIRHGRASQGVLALLRQAGRDPSKIVSSDLAFAAGPRLNAAGRLEDMSVGIECLLADDAATAQNYAETLDQINRERREIEAGMRAQAFAFVDAMEDRNLPSCVCVYDSSWHQGVVGLVAARVKERCHRPAIAFARESEGSLKGSARSVSGVHIRDVLEAVSSQQPGLIDKFGGHAMAAGLSLKEENLQAFTDAVSKQLDKLYPMADFSGAILTDGSLPASSMNLNFARMLRDAGPWGAGFPEPVFSGNFTVIEQRTVGENHLKMKVQPRAGRETIDAIAFNQAGESCRGTVQLTYRLDVNEFRGFESAQMVVEQITEMA